MLTFLVKNRKMKLSGKSIFWEDAKKLQVKSRTRSRASSSSNLKGPKGLSCVPQNYWILWSNDATATKTYTCQLSRLGRESHACGPISHAWLKNVTCCRPAWHNFQKYVNSDPCKERKPCVKWTNGNTFLAISDFWSEKHWERARLWQTSADFGRLRKTSDFYGNLRKWSCRLQKSQHSQDKTLTLISQKKLAGTCICFLILHFLQDTPELPTEGSELPWNTLNDKH